MSSWLPCTCLTNVATSCLEMAAAGDAMAGNVKLRVSAYVRRDYVFVAREASFIWNPVRSDCVRVLVLPGAGHGIHKASVRFLVKKLPADSVFVLQR